MKPEELKYAKSSVGGMRNYALAHNLKSRIINPNGVKNEQKQHDCKPDAEYSMLIIPDVHGRTFWKEAVAAYPDLPVVFLGDYLDPYHNGLENIHVPDAYRNFEEILEYKKANPQRVTLLLGNHDLHYLLEDMNCSRKDYCLEPMVRCQLEENESLFEMAACATFPGRQVLLTHAGVLAGWLLKSVPDISGLDAQTICTALNSLFHDKQTREMFVSSLLSDCSSCRGGYSTYGSPVWADVEEHEDSEKRRLTLAEDIYQVFGHTQQEKDPVYGNHYACLDCRRAFLLTGEGEVTEINQKI